MDKYAELANLFNTSASTGSADLDALFGIDPNADAARAQRAAERQARIEALLSEEQGVGPSQGRGTTTANKNLLPEQRALLDTIAGSESPDYRTVYGGKKVADLSWHPGIDVPIQQGPNAGKTSSAAGRYQFLKGTWEDQAKKLGLRDFSPENQDIAAWDLAASTYASKTGRDLLGDLRSNDPAIHRGITASLAPVWTSLPGGIEQGQSHSAYINRYQTALSREMGQPIQSPAGSPADQLLPSAPEQPDLSGHELVMLTDGSEAYFRKGTSPEEMVKKLQADNVSALPTRPFTAPNGESVLVRYNMTDDEALAKIAKNTPELMVRDGGKPPEEKSGYLAAAKKGVLEAVGPIATGLGGEAQRFGEYLGPESTIGGYATEAGKAMREYGAKTSKEAEEAFQMPKDASWIEKNFTYPLAEGAGQLLPYGAAFAVPGAGLGTAAGLTTLYGGAMGEAERKMAETGQEFVPSEGRMVAGADVALNMVGLRMLGPLKKVFGPEAEQAPREFVQGLIAEHGLDGAKAKMGSVVGDVLKGAGVSGGANIANEVAEDMLYRGYAGQDLFSPEALQSYVETAKQVAPIGVGMGVVHGGAKAHVKAEEIARAEEQQQTAEALQAQEKADEIATFEDRMRSARTDVNRLAAYRDQALGEFEGREDLTPEEQARVATLQSDDASKILDDFITQKQERKAAEQAALPEDLRGLPTEEAKLLQRARAGLTQERGIMPSKSEEQITYATPREQDIIQEGAQSVLRDTTEDYGLGAETSIRGMDTLTQRVQDVIQDFAEKGPDSAKQLLGKSVQGNTGKKAILDYLDRNGAEVRASGDYGKFAREALTEIGTRSPQGREWVEQQSRKFGALAEQRAPEGARERVRREMGEAPRAMQGVSELETKAPSERLMYGVLPTPETQQIGVIPSAQQITQAGEIRSDVSQLPGEGEEVGYVPKGGERMVEEGRQERPVIEGYEKPEIREVKGQEVADKAYHAGDLGYGHDTTLGRMSGGRSTGHFGTGVYFVGDKSRIGSRADRPVHEVDFSDYNLAKPGDEADAQDLHNGLRDINRLVEHVKDGVLQPSDKVNDLLRSASFGLKYSVYPKKDGRHITQDEIKDAIIKNVQERAPVSDKVFATSAYEDTAATRVMKDLGFEGVDVRHIPRFDSGDYGSVIYKESLAPTEISEVKGQEVAPSVQNKIIERMSEVPEEGDLGINCDVFAHRITGTNFKKLPTVELGQEKVGDVYAFGKSHYAVNVGDGKVAEVEEWGSPPQIRSIKDVINEHDVPTHIYSVPEEAYLPDVTKPEISEARGYVEYPDLGKLPLDVEKFKDVTNAKDLFSRYMEHGTDEGILDLARQFAESSHAAGIKVKFVSGAQDAPPAVWNRMKNGAGAVTATDRQGSTLYFQTKPGSFSEDYLGHEAIHGMTVGSLKRSPHLQKELGTISGSIGKAFEHFAKQNATDEKARDLSDFWNKIIKSSPDELLAYGLTAPTFRQILSQYAADGRPLSAIRTEAEMAKVRMRPTMPEEVTAKAPAPLTLWDKFTDFMRKLFRIPEKNKLAFEKALNDYTAKQAEYEQGVRDYQTLKPLEKKLHESLRELLDVTEREGTGLPPYGAQKIIRQETGVPKEGEALVPPTKEQQKLLLSEIQKSGLTASARKGTLGESMGAMIHKAVFDDIMTPFQQAVFDERAPIMKALKSLPANVGKKLRADLAWAAYSSRGNAIQQAIKNGYNKIGTDGTLEAVNNSQLAPEKIYERIRDHAKKLGMSPAEAEKIVSEMLVRLRAGTIREQDAYNRNLASNMFARADELEQFAQEMKGGERKKFISAAAKLRKMAEEKLESVGEEGRTYITPEQVSEGHQLYQMYKDTLSKEVDNIHTLLRTIPDMLFESGMIDANQRDEFQKYPFYFPFYDKAKFDEDMIDPLKEERLQSYLKGMGRGLKSVSEVKKQEAHGHTIYTGDNLVRHLMYWASAASEHTNRSNTCKQLEITGGATRLKGEPSDKNFVVKIKEDGRDVFYKIIDPTVYYAFQSAGPVTNSFVKLLQKAAHIQRNFAVFTPLFWYKQIVREPKQASRLAKVGIITPMDAMVELGKIAVGKSKGYKRIQEKGVVGPVDLAGTPAERVIMLTQGKSMPTKVLEGLHHIHEAVDAATRAIVYDRAVEKYKKWGFDEETADALAIKDARELMNFARQGKSSTVRNLRAMTPFLGSYINSIDVILKALSPEKYGKLSKADAMEARRQFLGISSSLMMMSMAYTLAMSDDDEWVNREDRNSNVLMRNPFPNKDKHPFIAFPLEFELGWLQHTLPENMILANLGAIAPTSMAANLKQSAANFLIPPAGFASIARPMIIKALQIEDEKYNFGTSRSMANTARGLEEFQDARASELTKELYEKLKDSGIQMFSPDEMEKQMRAVFGGAWAVATSAGDFLFAQRTGAPVMPAKTVTEQIPFGTGLFPKEFKDVAVRDAFSVLDDVNKVMSTFSKARNTRNEQDYNAILANPEYQKAIAADKALSGLGKNMEEISTKMQIITNDMDLSAEEKRKQNDELAAERETIAKEILTRAKLLGVYE